MNLGDGLSQIPLKKEGIQRVQGVYQRDPEEEPKIAFRLQIINGPRIHPEVPLILDMRAAVSLN